MEGGKWALIGGFVDRDETIAQAVLREVLEETGYKVENTRLLTIRDNPGRPHEDRQNIAFVYIAQALEKEEEADKESTEQKWFEFGNLPKKEEMAFDHYSDIKLYLENKDLRSLPILNL